MAIKLKQYLENSWYRGASQDRQSGYAAQFQYGENVNIRDMKNGVCLSGGATNLRTETYASSFFTCSIYGVSALYSVDTKGNIRLVDTGAVKCALNKTFHYPPIGLQFGTDAYIIGDAGIFKVVLGTWSSTDVSPVGYTLGAYCALNYANTYLIFGDLNKVWRISRDGTTKCIREFDESYIVRGLTQEGNYLKIYVSDGTNTKIHYAKGTFDVEETGLVQTVTFNGLNLGDAPIGSYVNTNCITSDQGTDYAVLQFAPGELKLAKISGYSKTDIRWTQTWDGQKIFTGANPKIMSSDGVLFAATDEGIWTFTEYNGWLWGGCVEFKETNPIESLFRYGERLYVCVKTGDSSYIVRYYDLSFHPTKYQSNGFIIGRVFDGGCAGLFKKNDQATITYNMPSDTSMELRYRYDRETFRYNKSNFHLIKKLEDTKECYDIVVPTTPSTSTAISLLRKEEANDLILLENGNGILLEDMLVCPFNKTWNLLEYRFDMSTTNTSKTPTLYEHSLTYYDYMRKYR